MAKMTPELFKLYSEDDQYAFLKELSKDESNKSLVTELFNVCNEPQDSEALRAELDELYKEQEKNYRAFVQSEANVDRKQNAVDKTSGILFANHGKYEGELQAAQLQSALIMMEYAANTEMLSKAADIMTQEELQRFMDLNAKVKELLNRNNQEEAPQTPPDPTVPTPVGQMFAAMGDNLTCTFAMGGQTALLVDPSRRVLQEGALMANIMDYTSKSIPTFGMCNSLANPAVASATAAAYGVLTPMPCAPFVVAPWIGGKPDILVGGAPVLLKTGTCQCMWGGSISIMPDAPAPPAANGDGIDHDEILKDKTVTKVAELSAKYLFKMFDWKAGKLLGEAIFEEGMVVANVAKLQQGLKYAKIAKVGGKALPIIGAVLTGVDFAVTDTSNYAKSGADASAKHDGKKPGSASEWGQVIGDYGAGFYKDLGVPDGVANFGNFMVRDTANTIDALNTAGSKLGAGLAESFSAPEWLIDIFG